MKPLVSILMTVYNREDFLAEAIESVLDSTYQEWELIIVDDLSHDRSVEIAERYTEKDDRVSLYINEKNLGDYPNRNRAASYAKGKYLKYLDSDDLIYKESLDTIVGFMEQYPSAAIGMETDSKLLVGKAFRFIPGPEVLRISFLEKAFMLCGPTGTIIRKDAFDRLNGFGENPFVGSDTVFYLRSALRNDILIFSKRYMYYRVHENQEFNIRRKEYFIRFYSEYRNLINHPDSPFSKKEKRKAKIKLRNLYLGQTLRFLKKGNIRYANYTFVKSGFYRRFFFPWLIS